MNSPSTERHLLAQARLEEIKMVFERTFAGRDGKFVIAELRRRTRGTPKSEFEAAKMCGAQSVIDMIIDLAGIFDGGENG
jgi:hypothetical protein